MRITGAVVLVLSLAGCMDSAGFEVAPSTLPPPHSDSPFYYVDHLDWGELHEHHGQAAVLWGVAEVLTGCMIPEGCGPSARLRSADGSLRLPLTPLSPRFDAILVSVHGTFRPMTPEELESTDYTEPRYWPSTIFEVKEIRPRGGVRIDELGPVLITHVENWYGCQFPRSQSDRVDYWDHRHHFAIRWEYYDPVEAKADPERFITFWFDAEDGRITHVQSRGLHEGPYQCWTPWSP